MTRRGLVCLALLAATACSSSGEGSPGSDGSDPTVPVPATDAEATTTTSPPTTTVTTTSSSTTTTTLAPTTTVDPMVQLAADIERDLNLGEQALLAAAADPGNEALRQELQRFYSGTSLQLLIETLDVMVADGLMARPNPEVASVVRIREIFDLAEDPTADPTLVELCRVDAGVIYQPLDGGGEIIVNDRVVVEVSDSRVYRVEGVWVLDGGVLSEALSPEERC